MFNSVASYIIKQLADNPPTDATLRLPAWHEAVVELRRRAGLSSPTTVFPRLNASVLLKVSLRLRDARGVSLG